MHSRAERHETASKVDDVWAGLRLPVIAHDRRSTTRGA